MINTVTFGIGDRDGSDHQYYAIPLEEIQIPKDNHRCIINRYWLSVNNLALFYGLTPQCNTDKRVIDYIIEHNDYLNQTFPGIECVLIPFAYIDDHDGG